MLAAVVSDVHANPFALRAVLDDARRAGADELWIAGDTFGYHPWAAETFRQLDGRVAVAVLGNHDRWVLDRDSRPGGVCGRAAGHNAAELATRAPRALAWLASLAPRRSFARGRWTVTIAHGTPDDPLEGRLYPDDARPRRWAPGPGEILVLGHTHWPLLRGDGDRGLLLNPGSVGQPRDRRALPSWALLDLRAGTAQLRRTVYDRAAVAARLVALGWEDAVVRAFVRDDPAIARPHRGPPGPSPPARSPSTNP